MAKTFTAHVAVGTQNEGGILPTHVAWLFENSRPVWMLEPTRLRLTGEGTYDHRPGTTKLIRWVPEGPEHILEDGLLLIAMHAFGDDAVLRLATDLIPALVDMKSMKSAERDIGVEYGCDLDALVNNDPAASEHLARLRELVLDRLPDSGKLAVSVLDGSSIAGQLPILERSSIEVAACTVTYLRQRAMGAWGAVDPAAGAGVFGSLEPPSGGEGHRYTEIRL